MTDKTETEARQGKRGTTAFSILQISLALAAVALFALFAVTAMRGADVRQGPPADPPAEVEAT